MALVIYNPLPFMEHFNANQRVLEIPGLTNITISQNWNDFGVSAVVWEAAIILSTFLQSIKPEIQGKRVLELGSGTGVCGIVASLLGSNVTMTDLKTCLNACQQNMERNLDKSMHHAQIKSLDWTEDLSSDWSEAVFDYIIGADLVYIEELFEYLIATFEYFSKLNRNITIFLAGKIRYMARYQKFKNMLENTFNIQFINVKSQGFYLMKIRLNISE